MFLKVKDFIKYFNLVDLFPILVLTSDDGNVDHRVKSVTYDLSLDNHRQLASILYGDYSIVNIRLVDGSCRLLVMNEVTL